LHDFYPDISSTNHLIRTAFEGAKIRDFKIEFDGFDEVIEVGIQFPGFGNREAAAVFNPIFFTPFINLFFLPNRVGMSGKQGGFLTTALHWQTFDLRC